MNYFEGHLVKNTRNVVIRLTNTAQLYLPPFSLHFAVFMHYMTACNHEKLFSFDTTDTTADQVPVANLLVWPAVSVFTKPSISLISEILF